MKNSTWLLLSVTSLSITNAIGLYQVNSMAAVVLAAAFFICRAIEEK